MADPTAPPSYIDYQVGGAPPWLSGPNGVAWESCMGAAKNLLAEATTAAISSRFIASPTLSPVDALIQVGADRLLERMPTETDDAYRARLVNAWSSYQWAGTKKGILDALATAGYSNVVLTENWEYTGPGADPTQWWRFWVTIKRPHDLGVAGPRWGSFRWGDGTRWSGLNKPRVDLVKRLIRKWKPAHATCVNVTVLLSGRLWGDGWKFGDGTRWGGEAATFIP